MPPILETVAEVRCAQCGHRWFPRLARRPARCSSCFTRHVYGPREPRKHHRALPKGTFVVLEGGEGAGKSSVRQALGERLQGEGPEVVMTREPGGTPLGERIRNLVLARTAVDDPLAELLLFEAARAHLVASVIRPALARGALVLCDRFSASSVAYQGYGRGLGREIVERANALALGGLEPDLTLLFDLPVAQGLARRSSEGEANHFDRAATAFHERVRAGFLELARESPARWRIIDASQPLDSVIEAAHAAITSRISVDAEPS